MSVGIDRSSHSWSRLLRAARRSTVAATVAVTVAMVVAGCAPTTGGRHSASTPTSPTIPIGTGTGDTSPTAAAGATGTLPVATFPSASNLVTLDGKARSLETTAALGGVTSIHLSGSSVLTSSADVTDHGGHHLGTGTLRTTGSDLVIAGPNVVAVGRVRVQPGVVTFSSPVTLNLSGPSTIAAGTITFQPPAPAVASTSNPPVTTVAPPPVAVTGPVTVAPGSLQVTGAALRYADAPTDLSFASSEADLSWAGSGSITTSTGPLQAPYLGVRAQNLSVSVHRSSAEVDVHGTGLALQAYANGVPQLRTAAGVDILSTHATTGFLGQKRAFVWTPRNLGSTYDMAILRIRPGNAAAGGVHVGLLPMPPMFGGEPHALVGGDTSGLKGGGAMDSLIARHGDDKRSIGYDAAPGVPLVLIVEGNFDPITVTITTY